MIFLFRGGNLASWLVEESACAWVSDQIIVLRAQGSRGEYFVEEAAGSDGCHVWGAEVNGHGAVSGVWTPS